MTRYDRSLTPTIRQGTKEGPTPSLPEGAAPANVAVGSQDATDEGGPRRGWRKLTVSQGISSLTARQAPRRSPRTAATRETLRRPRRRRRPPPLPRAATRRPAAGRGRPWRCCCPTAGSAFPTRSWGSPRTTRPRARAQSSPSWAGGVVGLGRVPTGPGVAFLSALGKPGHFSAADVIRRPLGDPCGRALRCLLFERGEMRLARHELPYGRHSPRHPVMGPAGHLALRAASRPRGGPRGRAHDQAAQGGHATRGGTRASTSRENTNGSSGICMGCCLGEDGKLAAALA